ncbi:hypothetical protein HDIA_1349 [Hartmannibacter diazotrophicus]|uniref:Bacteriophage phiJL001 Gp84 C-terminal domain-containing protein n=1 Tax=Hartmannibacter diazotrophicus TaxID=1482074 RepID=A0A2C9D3Q1_9HYPH|nr:DUF2163 domain-containing protein [Hartmannibacter diazotrophicus]SON54890.1 hypothetical protein HDIA_1349 [Hartmannibacter diazotrophicus]
MLEISSALAERLASGATTLAACWKLTRADGMVLGFTDHDRDLNFDGTVFRSSVGLDGSTLAGASDLSVGDGDVAGAISDDALSEEDLLAGRWDGAEVAIWLVDWNSPDDRTLLSVATIGEVTRRDGAFKAELRGAAAELERNGGRVFARHCDAVFGDARCGVDASNPVWRGEGTVTQDAGSAVLALSGFSSFDSGWFSGGVLTFLGGPLAGREIGVERHAQDGEMASVTLWRSLPLTVPAGTAVAMIAGCDKRFETCSAKFANTLNFRGFPHIPGNDFAFSYARSNGNNDGGVLFE